VRAALYQSRRTELGCPDDGICTLHLKHGKEVQCGPDGCSNYFAVKVPPLDVKFGIRLAFLRRIENYKEVGVRFSMEDFDASTWDELIVLAQERQYMDGVIDKARRRRDRPDEQVAPDVEKQIEQARRELGVPPPGQSLFR
jgi:hypothetical protein